MKKLPLLLAPLAASFTLSVHAQSPVEKQVVPTPNEIVEKAESTDWVAIDPMDLLVMDLTDVKGKPRRVVIQLMPVPFSQGWVANIRKLVMAKFWDGTSVNRVQDNYVVQWGDASEEKALPKDLAVVPVSEYEVTMEVAATTGFFDTAFLHNKRLSEESKARDDQENSPRNPKIIRLPKADKRRDAYSEFQTFFFGWPIAGWSNLWPVHCYGMVGVGRNYSPDTGTGAELYTVIGHAPRHLDRNIAVVGRIIEGMEHLSSLPRGTGPLGFYETPEERITIMAIRMGDEVMGLPAFEYLNTKSESFNKYADARANRRDPFFIKPAGGADICNIPVPVRRKPAD